MASEARQKSDWNLLTRTLEVMQTLKIGVLSETTATLNALHAYLSGLEQERAHDYPAAAESFQAALQNGTQIPPAELVGGHLERLRNKHPQEFMQAMNKIGNKPIPPDPLAHDISYLLNAQRPDFPKPPDPAVLIIPPKKPSK